MASEGGRRVTLDDAIDYILELKVALAEEMQKFDNFLQIMNDFKERRIGINDVKAAAMDIFEGRDDLIVGFNTFLPAGYKIQLSGEGEQPINTVVPRDENLKNFEIKVKSRFEENSEIYKSFLAIMNLLGEGKKSIPDIYQEVAALLEGHADLLSEWSQFLP